LINVLHGDQEEGHLWSYNHRGHGSDGLDPTKPIPRCHMALVGWLW